MFSPHYARARRRGRADPLDHVSVNAILYGPKANRWAMTERRSNALFRSAETLSIGPSSLTWRDGRLQVEISEWATPLPRKLVGSIDIDLGPCFDRVHALDVEGRHLWRPIAPRARATVRFLQPDLAWSGSAYIDMNAGSEPLESRFRSWFWSRGARADRTTIHYDLDLRDGGSRSLAFDYHDDGCVSHADRPPIADLPTTLWRVDRRVRTQAPPCLLATLEDTPFYTRSRVAARHAGEACETICESVDLDRFSRRWVQGLLPFRMPRRAF